MARRNRRSQSWTDRGQTSRRLVFLVGGALGLLFLFSFFFDEMGFPKYLRMLQHAGQLERDIQELKETNAELRQEIDDILHRPAKIEELARDRLGYVREGETVYQILEESQQ